MTNSTTRQSLHVQPSARGITMERGKLEAIVGKLLAAPPMSRAAMAAKRKLERQAMKSKVTDEP